MADNGLTAWDALREFCGGELPPDIDPVHYDYKQWEPFHEVLAVGSWYATGAPAPGAKAKRIFAGLWAHGLYIDPNTDIASGIGYEFTDVRFFYSKHTGKTKKPSPAPRRKLRDFLTERLAKLLAAGQESSARQDEEAARKHFKGYSINRDWVAEIRDEIGVPREWSKRGPRPKN